MDRRTALRFFLQLPAHLSSVSEFHNGPVRAITRDISHTGAFIQTEADFRLGQEVKILLHLRERIFNASNMNGLGRVVRIEPDGVAVSFLTNLAPVGT